MTMYAYHKEGAGWYRGLNSAGRVMNAESFEDATFFTSETVNDADDCLGWGYDLYSMEVSKPVLIQRSSNPHGQQAPRQSFSDWEVHPMSLFGEN